MSTIQIYEVGGCVRDEMLGTPTKDIDFTVVAPSFEDMREFLLSEGFTVHTETEQFQTIRCGVPKGHVLRNRTNDADFVWARKEGPYTDGRRPDWVRPGTLEDDLARRDFTINAMARTVGGKLIDPHGGRLDLKDRILRFVGDPNERIQEDGLRVLRGLRFIITKDLIATWDTWDAMNSHHAVAALRLISHERCKDELDRMFAHDTLHTLHLLSTVSINVKAAIFRGPLHLQASMKGK